MQLTGLWPLGLLLLGGLSCLPNTHAITEEEKKTILEGIEAGKTFTTVLQEEDFSDVMTAFPLAISPWIKGIAIFGKLLGKFLPEENEMLDEMKKGFNEVNKMPSKMRSQQ